MITSEHLCTLFMFYGLSTFGAITVLDKLNNRLMDREHSKYVWFLLVYFPGINTIFSLFVGLNLLKKYILG